MKRRRDLEKQTPRAVRRALGTDRLRYYDCDGEVVALIIASHRSEAEIARMIEEGLAMRRAADLALTPVEGGVQ